MRRVFVTCEGPTYKKVHLNSSPVFYPTLRRRVVARILLMAIALAIPTSFATASDMNARTPRSGPDTPGTPSANAESREARESLARELLELWQSTCLKHHRNPLALRAALLQAGHREKPEGAESFLNGYAGTVWDVGNGLDAQRMLLMLDNGICEIRAQKADARILDDGFRKIVEAMAVEGPEGITVQPVPNTRFSDFGGLQKNTVYRVSNDVGAHAFYMACASSDSPLIPTQAVLAIAPVPEPEQKKNRRPRITFR